MPTIILDADFLSSFLKIERLDLVREFYRVSVVNICPSVHREIAATDLLIQLVAVVWLQVTAPDAAILNGLMSDEEFCNLGAGEQESIALAKERSDSILMMSDNKARRVAARMGTAVINIPAFLLACKTDNWLDRNALQMLVRDLRERDYYEFRQDVLEALLS
jgi:predicted nucleic acid-binding protein